MNNIRLKIFEYNRANPTKEKMTSRSLGKKIFEQLPDEDDNKYKDRIDVKMTRICSASRVKEDILIKIAKVLQCKKEDLIS